MSQNLEYMISTHGPTVLKNIVAARGKVSLLSVHHDYSLSRGNTPNDGNIVLFTTAIGSSLAFCQSLGIDKSKSPVNKWVKVQYNCVSQVTCS